MKKNGEMNEGMVEVKGELTPEQMEAEMQKYAEAKFMIGMDRLEV